MAKIKETRDASCVKRDGMLITIESADGGFHDPAKCWTTAHNEVDRPCPRALSCLPVRSAVTPNLGHDPLPDCPRCGYDYQEAEGFRWDVLAYLLVILGILSFLLMTSYYRGMLGSGESWPPVTHETTRERLPEKWLGSDAF